jgi:hypothetical protein
MTVEKKVSDWFCHPYLKMAESENENERLEFLRLLASSLGLPRPDSENKIESAYVWQRALVKAIHERGEARDREIKAQSMLNFFERHYEIAAGDLGLKVEK